ncbi:hypothetical protein LTS08_001538 [Lithohypha guttulata]|nr:hypothetical protein LTS08_001538 [Lithohypha guttulata]
MRLLYKNSRGQIVLTRKLYRTPSDPYAILSHTWSLEEDDEVNFQDVTAGHWKGKLGAQKLEWCADRTKEAGLKYFWVDTCCFDKTSSAELNETITSMYRYYKNAKVCLVYLADIDNPDRFKGCKWFTRAWTLQELLAPNDVQFFTPRGKYLGDKKSLASQIQRITAIPASALSGESLSKFTRNERLAWAKGRETKRTEDWSYSLLGILQVDMYINYGEGNRASTRLKEAIKVADEKGNPKNRNRAATPTTSKTKASTGKITVPKATERPRVSSNQNVKQKARKSSTPRLDRALGARASLPNGVVTGSGHSQIPQRDRTKQGARRPESRQKSRSRVDSSKDTRRSLTSQQKSNTRNLNTAGSSPMKKPKRRFLCV